MTARKPPAPAAPRRTPAAHSRTPATPRRQTIIMIHGFRGTHHGLMLIGKQLKKTTPGLSVIIPDLPGFGRGPKLKQYDLDSYVEWLHGFIKKQGLHQAPLLMGHSFGSIVCAAYAKKYPRTIKKLILVNPIGSPALEGPNKVMTKLATLYYTIGAKLPQRLAHGWLAAKPVVRIMSITMTKTHDKGLRTFIHHQHDRYFSQFHSAESVLQGFTVSVSHNVSEFAADIPVSTLLIAGSLDDVTPLSDQYILAKKFPSATLKVISDVGHLTHYETPETVARHIQIFITSV